MVKRGQIHWINLNPTRGAEINKMRPGLIISPDEMNDNLDTVIIAPCTSKIKNGYPTRVKTVIDGRDAHIVLDQIGTIDKGRIGAHIQHINQEELEEVLEVLQELFTL